MAKSVVELGVKDGGFNSKIKDAIRTFSSLSNAVSNAKGQFAKFSDGVAKVAQSQELLNAALKGNPYGLMAQAATMAFTKIIESATAATDAEMRAVEWAQQKAEIEQKANEQIGRSTGDLMAKYELLRVQWLNLSSDQQRNEWIKENQSAFKSLNLAVDGVTSAENIFVNNTSKVVAALSARAEAEAYAELYKDQIKQNAMNKASGKYKTQLITDPYYRPSEIEAQLAGFTTTNKHENFEYQWVENADPRNPGKHREWTGRLSKLGLQRLNANRQLGAASLENADRMLAEQYASKMAAAQLNANALQNNNLFGRFGGGSGKGGSGRGVQSVVTAAQQTEYQQNQIRINELTQEYVRISDDATEDVKERQQQIREEITLLERRNNLLKLYEDQAHGKLLGGTVETPTQGNVTGGLSVPKDGLGKGFKLQVQEAVDGGKQVEKSWRSAAQAASQFGSALQGIDDPAAKIAGTIAQAVANIALAFSSADLKDGETGNVWYWIAATAAGVATMISTISTIRSATSGYAEGGIVNGNSYSGDQVYARLNAGELVLTKAMQGNLASQLSDQNRGIHIVGVVQGENIVLAARTYGQRWGKNFLIKQG